MPDYLDKVRKLLERTTDRGHTVAEAATAAAAAQTIIDKHRLDLALLLPAEEDDPDEEPIQHCTDFPLFVVARRLPLWKWDLIWALGEANACQPWSSYEPDGEGNYHRVAYVIGRPSDAQTVQYLHQHLCREIDHLAKQHRGEGRVWMNNFRLGAVAEIAERLEAKRRYNRRALKRNARKAAKGDDPTALVKLETALSRLDAQAAAVEEWMKKNDMGHDDNPDVDDTHESPAAYEAGRTAGAKLPLEKNKTKALKAAT